MRTVFLARRGVASHFILGDEVTVAEDVRGNKPAAENTATVLAWWDTSAVPALWRQNEFEASLA